MQGQTLNCIDCGAELTYEAGTEPAEPCCARCVGKRYRAEQAPREFLMLCASCNQARAELIVIAGSDACPRGTVLCSSCASTTAASCDRLICVQWTAPVEDAKRQLAHTLACNLDLSAMEARCRVETIMHTLTRHGTMGAEKFVAALDAMREAIES